MGVLSIHAMTPHRSHRSPLEWMIHMTLFIVLDKKLNDMNGGISGKLPWCSLRKQRHNHLSSMEDNQDKEYPKTVSKEVDHGESIMAGKEPNIPPAPKSWNMHEMKLIDATATLRLHSRSHHHRKLENLFSSYDHHAPPSTTPEQLLTPSQPLPQQQQHRQISLQLSSSLSRYQQTADGGSCDNSQFILQRPISLRRVSAGGNYPVDYFQQRIQYAHYPCFPYFNNPSPAASQFYNTYYYYGYHS